MRVEGWPRRLNEYIASLNPPANGVEYGRLDCCTFVADWVLILTGEDPMAEYRGRYATEAEAFALLTEIDGTLYRALRKRFGNPVHPLKAQRGDIAYRKDDQAVGIFFTSGGRTHALFLTKGGFALHRARDIDHCFQVR